MQQYILYISSISVLPLLVFTSLYMNFMSLGNKYYFIAIVIVNQPFRLISDSKMDH